MCLNRDKIVRYTLFIFLYLVTVGNSWGQNGAMTDARDGRVYKTVQIGSQVWMAENLAYAPVVTYTYNNYRLNYTYYRDSSYYFCYQDSLGNLNKCGALYPWETAVKVCPTGWHLPSALEFEMLFETVGDDKKSAFKALIKGGNSGFDALLCGELYYFPDLFPKFRYKNKYTFFWTSNDKKRAGLSGSLKRVLLNTSIHEDAFSVRCVKD
jgi:uncharacterized protein (TIGR02145 family)